MEEDRLAFLYKAATILSQNQNKGYDILRSHYIMRCPELRSSKETFSGRLNKERCSYCCLEWNKNEKLRVKTTKLSRRQKTRIKYKKNKIILGSKEVERVCSLCGNTSTVYVVKLNDKMKTDTTVVVKDQIKKPIVKKELNVRPLNVYTNIREVFSLKNEHNKVTSDLVPVKINNNKKKKDRFAGLCQKAVIDAAKRKKVDEKQNKLNLFLKPSL